MKKHKKNDKCACIKCTPDAQKAPEENPNATMCSCGWKHALAPDVIRFRSANTLLSISAEALLNARTLLQSTHQHYHFARQARKQECLEMAQKLLTMAQSDGYLCGNTAGENVCSPYRTFKQLCQAEGNEGGG